MPTGWLTYPVQLSGGLVRSMPRLQQGMDLPGSARVLENFEASYKGGYRRINGYNKYIEQAVPGTGRIEGLILSDLQNPCMVLRNGILYSWNTTEWIDRTPTGWTPGGRTARHQLFNFGEGPKVVLVDGRNAPAVINFNGTSSVITEADVVGSSHVVDFKNHLFFAKASQLSFSEPGVPSGFSPANGAGVLSFPSRITGLTTFRDQLIVFCEEGIWRLVGSSFADFQLLQITTRTGCIQEDTIQEVGGDILYLGPDGVRYLGATERIGDFRLSSASNQIHEQIAIQLDQNQSFSSIVIPEKNQYRIFGYKESLNKALAKGFCGTQFDNQNPLGISWSSLSGIKAYRTAHRRVLQNQLTVFTNDDDYVYLMESGSTFDGADINSLYYTPYFSMDDPRIRKTAYKLRVMSELEGSMKCRLSSRFDFGDTRAILPPNRVLDASGGGIKWGDLVWGQSKWGGRNLQEIDTNLIGSFFSLSLEFTSMGGDPFLFDTLLLDYALHDRK